MLHITLNAVCAIPYILSAFDSFTLNLAEQISLQTFICRFAKYLGCFYPFSYIETVCRCFYLNMPYKNSTTLLYKYYSIFPPLYIYNITEILADLWLRKCPHSLDLIEVNYYTSGLSVAHDSEKGESPISTGCCTSYRSYYCRIL